MQSKSLLALAILAAAITLSGCSKKLRSDYEGEAIAGALSTRNQLDDALRRSETERAQITSYSAKNATVSVAMGKDSHTARANVQFEQGKPTEVSVRLPFPPISVGTATLDGSKASVKSGLLNIDKTQQFPFDINGMVQTALLGGVPQFYLVFGDKDYSKFDMWINRNGLYQLARTEGPVSVSLLVTPQGMQLTSFELIYAGNKLTYANTAFSDFGKWNLPSKIDVSVIDAKKRAEQRASFEISKLTVK